MAAPQVSPLPDAVHRHMTPSAIDFFAEAKARSLHKLDLYRKYLVPFVRKVGRFVGPGRASRHIWIVDGFAGAGQYKPDDGGQAQDGSPLIAAKFAESVATDRGVPLVRCINVERNRGCFDELEENLAPWSGYAQNLRGTFAQQRERVLDTIGGDPAFVFLDPFGVNGIEMEVIEKLLARTGVTELLVHFSDRTVLRMAGHLDENDQRLPIGHKVAESKLARLDAVIGTSEWRRLWSEPVDTTVAMDATVELYLSELRKRISYANEIKMRDSFSARAAYRLVFCTGSPHGVELMSDIACRYERGLKDAHDGSAMSLLDEYDKRQHLTNLRDTVYEVGIRRQVASSQDIIHELAPKLFGQYITSDYARVIRELVVAALIDRATPTGIKPQEELRFVEPDQGSLLNQAS